MNHLGTKRIETSRLILRPFVKADAEAMYRNWASDAEVTKFLSWPTYKSVDTACEILDIWTKQYSDNIFYQDEICQGVFLQIRTNLQNSQK